MNLKRAKLLRKTLRQHLIETGITLPERELRYKDTKKIVGYTFPQGWLKFNFVQLATVGGPWFEEAKKLAVPVYARIAVNVPGTQRYIYRQAKRTHARA